MFEVDYSKKVLNLSNLLDPLGTLMVPSYSNLFVGFIEELIFERYSGPKPELFGRYIDYCFGATPCSKPLQEDFISYVNAFHPSLDFT